MFGRKPAWAFELHCDDDRYRYGDNKHDYSPKSLYTQKDIVNTEYMNFAETANYEIHRRVGANLRWKRERTVYHMSSAHEALNSIAAYSNFRDGEKILLRNVTTGELFEFKASVPTKTTFMQI